LGPNMVVPRVSVGSRAKSHPQITQIAQITKRGKRQRQGPHAKPQRRKAGIGQRGDEGMHGPAIARPAGKLRDAGKVGASAVWLAAHFNGRVFGRHAPLATKRHGGLSCRRRGDPA
jgi:hypothetical protein